MLKISTVQTEFLALEDNYFHVQRQQSDGVDFCNYANIRQYLHSYCMVVLYTFNHCVVNMLFTITFAGFYEVEKITGMDIREQQRYFHVK